MSKLPKWMRAHTRVCARAFALNDPGQRLYLRREHIITDAPEASGYTQTSGRYQRATVTIRSDNKPDARGYEVLTHELLHAAMIPNGQAVNRIIDLLPESLRDHALDLWHDANEQTVTRLARGLAPILRKP